MSVSIPVLGFPNEPDLALAADAIAVDVLVQPARVDDALGLRSGDERAMPLAEALARALTGGGDPVSGLVLLGHPGSGKTTLLRRLFVEALDRSTRSFGLEASLSPVFARLSRLTRAHLEPGGLARLIEAEAAADGFAGVSLVEPGQRYLFLLDGLDEVRDPAVRAEAAAWVAAEAGRWEGSAFVLTSRPAGYHAARGAEARLTPGWVRPLSTDAVAVYVHKWFPIALLRQLDFDQRRDPVRRAAAEREAAARAEALVAEIRRREREEELSWRDLSRNPLLLSALCLVANEPGGLPHGRGELYRRALEQLLRVATRKDPTQALPPEPAQRVLQPLAWAMRAEVRERDELTEWPVERARAEIEEPLRRERARLGGRDAAAFLDHAADTCGVLARPTEERIRFAHLTFQEYLAAREAQANPARRAALARHFGEPRWEEPTLLAVGMPGVFEPLVRDVLSRPLDDRFALLRRCLEETTDPRTPLVDWLREAARWPAWWPRAFGGRPAAEVRGVLELLRGSEEPEVLEVTRRLMSHGDPEVRRLAARVAGLESDAVRSRVDAKTGMALVWVPAERFVFGTARPEHVFDLPRRELVEPTGVWIGRFPVTNGQYRRFTEASGRCRAYSTWMRIQWGYRTFRNRPENEP